MTIDDPFTAPPPAPDDVEVDPADIARTELAENMIVVPADLLGDIGPMGQLLYLEQLAWHVLSGWTGMLAAADADDVGDDSEPVRALQAITLAAGMIDQACATVSLLPPEAGDAPPTATEA